MIYILKSSGLNFFFDKNCLNKDSVMSYSQYFKKELSLISIYVEQFSANFIILLNIVNKAALLLLCVIYIECDKSPIYPSDIITIIPEYVQAKDAWLYISTTSRSANPEVQLYQDNIQIDRFTLIQQDTIYHVTSLEINTEYSFKTVLKTKDEVEFTSPETRVVTLDTTSVITGWDEYILGGSIGGLFRDIEAINDDEVWAVGNFNSDSGRRNGARWNGSRWDLLEIPVLIYGSWETDSAFGPSNLEAMSAINNNDIWFSSGGEFFHYNGIRWGDYTFLFQSLNDPDFGYVRDVTVISHDNIWAAGDKGAVYHYNGITWQQVNSPTTEDLKTVTGHMTSDGYQVWIGGIDRLYYKSDGAEWQVILDGDPSVMDLTVAEVRVLRQFDQNNLYLAIWGQQGTERYIRIYLSCEFDGAGKKNFIRHDSTLV